MNAWKETWVEIARPENLPVGIAGGLGVLALIAAMTAVTPEPEPGPPPEAGPVSEPTLTVEQIRALIDARLPEQAVAAAAPAERVIEKQVTVPVSELLMGTVKRVIDGDSLVVRYDNGVEEEIRIAGIDAPEYDQPWGPEAAQAVLDIVGGQRVVVGTSGRDEYGRTLAAINFRCGEDKPGLCGLAVGMLRRGHAWHYKQYDDTQQYAEVEATALIEGIGLWGLPNPVPPWEWRERRIAASGRR